MWPVLAAQPASAVLCLGAHLVYWLKLMNMRENREISTGNDATCGTERVQRQAAAQKPYFSGGGSLLFDRP